MNMEKRPVNWTAIIICFLPVSIPYYIGKELAYEAGASNEIAIALGLILAVVVCGAVAVLLAKFFPDGKNSN